MNVLVIGAGGQLGTEIRNVAQSDSTKKGKKIQYVYADIAASGDIRQIDITDEDAVMRLVKEVGPDVIVNCAAYTDVEKAQGNPEDADMLNHLAVASLSEAARENKAVMIHISTDYVFSGNSSVPYLPTDETSPLSVYGLSKLAGERAVVNSGCSYIILRTAWLYSPYGKNFVKTMLALTSEKEEIKVVADQIGSPTCARDLAEFIVGIIRDGKCDREGIYHFTNEGVCSWYDLAVAVNSIACNECEVLPCRTEDYPTVAPRPHYSVLDKTSLKQAFGVKIPHWRDSLEECLYEMLGLEILKDR